ncbi:transglutaminase-like putative cysteine protease [Clostridiales Family XIII bacterium PM5-7]
MNHLRRKNKVAIFVAAILLWSLASSHFTVFAYTKALPGDSIPEFTSLDAASDYVYQQLLHQEETIKLTVITPHPNGKTVWQKIKKGAFADDADATALFGDYVRYNLYHHGKMSYAYYFSNGNYHYTFHLGMVYRTTLRQERQFSSKLSNVVDGLNLANKSDYRKVKAIYDYICQTVAYDDVHSSAYKRKYTAYAALINKRAVCQGYANLFYRMCKAANVPVRIVSGTSQKQKHSWNIVAIDGKYYNVDATWDAGKRKYAYFLKSNRSFKDHKRNAEYLTPSFQRNHLMSKKNH